MKQSLQQKYSALNQREKLIILCAGILAIVFIGYFHLLEPQTNQRHEVQNSIVRLDNELAVLNAQQQIYISHLQNDINAPLRDKKDRQDDILQQLDSNMSAFLANMVKPTDMAQVITSLLNQLNDVKVVSLSSVPPQLFSGNTDEAFHLYEHGLNLTLEAPYVKLFAFLSRAEQLPWQFYWKDYQLSVTEYPYSQLRIELRTYSLDKEFIQL